MKLTEDELELFFLWRGLSHDDQNRIIGRIEVFLEQQAREKDAAVKDAAVKEPGKNNVIRLANKGD